MRLFTLFAVIFALNSCNTGIGLYRDTKAACIWTKGKMQGTDGGGGGGDDYGAPVY